MGIDLCSDDPHNSNSLSNINNSKPIKNKSQKVDAKSSIIKDNDSIYSNSEQDINNNKYFNNETDINNLKSSIFDNEENDHAKKYEQEINTYDHPYIFNQNNNINKYENNDYYLIDSNNKEYTFKNSINSNNKILDYNKSKEFITNNKSSFKRFEILKNKDNKIDQELCSFGNDNNKILDLNNQKDKYSSNNSDIENNENEKDNNLILNEFINKDTIKKKINNLDLKAINKFAMNQLIKLQKRIRKSILTKNVNLNNNQSDNLLIPLNIINSAKDRTFTNEQKDFCVRYYNNGCIYIGQIKNNKCNGYGKFKNQYNDIIMGIFNNNYLHLYGIIERKNNNSIYEGELQNNTFSGIGIESFEDGATYYGQFYNNKKHGIGTYIWSNDFQYQGQWKNGEMNGLGVFWDEKGRNYEGSWLNGKMDGFGLFKWGDGRKYLGYFKNDKREGFGLFMWKNPLKIYIGFWKEGTQNGYGKVYSQFKEKGYLWNKGKKNKCFNNNDHMIQEIIKNNNSSIKNKAHIFKMSFDDLLSFILDK